MTITPLAPRRPYSARSAGFLRAVIDSMSAGLIHGNAPPAAVSTGVPSTTYSGPCSAMFDVGPIIRTTMQPPGADVLHALVHLRCDARDLLHPVGRELELRALGRDQRRVLLRQRVLGLRHDADEIGFAQ